MIKLVAVTVLILCGVEIAYAQEVPPFLPPDWLASVIVFGESIPVVGPILVELLKWSGFVAAILTAFSVFLIAVQKALEPMEKLSSVGPIVSKINGYIAKALPYVKYLSIFNVQKGK